MRKSFLKAYLMMILIVKMILMSCYHYISGFIFNLNNIFKYSMSKKIFKSSNFYVKIILLLHSFFLDFMKNQPYSNFN